MHKKRRNILVRKCMNSRLAAVYLSKKIFDVLEYSLVCKDIFL